MTAMQDAMGPQALNIYLDADMQMAKEIDAMVEELCAKWTDVEVGGQRLSVGFDHEGSDSLGLTESVSGRASACSISSQDPFQEDLPSLNMALDDGGEGMKHQSLEQMINNAVYESQAFVNPVSGIQQGEPKIDARVVAMLRERVCSSEIRDSSCSAYDMLERGSGPEPPAVETSQSQLSDDKAARYKTRICRNWLQGECEFGARCIFAHGHAELQSSEVGTSMQKQPKQKLVVNVQDKYKTRICHNWLNGHCEFGAGCTFAHGDSELRAGEKENADNSQNDLRHNVIGDPAKYKTTICRNWVTGECDFGARCFFAHGQGELRPLKEDKAPGSDCQSSVRCNALADPAKYKTTICRNWLTGQCDFGAKCFFAHGRAELRCVEEKVPRDGVETCQASAVGDAAKNQTTRYHSEHGNLPSQPEAVQALTKGAAAMQEMSRQVCEISSLYEQLGSGQPIGDPKSDRPQVIVDLQFFQSLLQIVLQVANNGPVHATHRGTDNCRVQQQPVSRGVTLQQLLKLKPH
jgi:hypothetical protein